MPPLDLLTEYRGLAPWDYDVVIVYGWEEDMTQEFKVLLPGPITAKMLEDEHFIPDLVVRGDRTYVYKEHDFQTGREGVEEAYERGYAEGMQDGTCCA